MKIIFILLIMSVLLTGCKHNRNKNVNTIIQEESNASDFIYEKPVIINKDDNKILQFPNSYIINISENYRQYKIDFINLYNSKNKESQYIEIKNEDVLLFKLPENDEWLYCFISDAINGYLYIYDISMESFYGNFDKNRESQNTYRIFLINEYELLKKHTNVKRYGPLLVIKYNHHVINFWDSFLGEKVSRGYRYQLLDYYDEYNEIYIRKYSWEGSEDYIYNIQSTEYVCDIEDIPYFNKSRDAVFSLEYGYGDPIVYLRLFIIKNGVYEKIIDKSVTLDYEYSTKGFWINNDEIQIEYIEKYYDNISDILKEKKVILLVSRKNPNFEFKIIRK